VSIAENEEKEHAGDAEEGGAGNYLLLQRTYAEENIERVSGFH
jgi:hypothetical protein